MSACTSFNRRHFIQGITGTMAAAAVTAKPNWSWAANRPQVGIARCTNYEYENVRAVLSNLFDMTGGVQSLVRNKHVTVKVNTTGHDPSPVYTLDRIYTVYTHPMVTLAACSLFEEYGAVSIAICESIPSRDPVLKCYHDDGYNTDTFKNMLNNVSFENTRNKGTGNQYLSAKTGDGAYLYSSFDFNHRYVNTDVFVSIAKMKNHDIAGITLSMKNLYGIAPNSIYGGAGSEPSENHTQVRTETFHSGTSRVGADGEIFPAANIRNPGKRVARVVVDLNRARPVDLAIIDGITTQSGGEGVWNGNQIGISVPNLLLAGRDALAVDTVGTSVMGFDPQAAHFTKPFYNGENTFQLAADLGMGTNNVNDIDVHGISIAEARYQFLPGKDYSR